MENIASLNEYGKKKKRRKASQKIAGSFSFPHFFGLFTALTAIRTTDAKGSRIFIPARKAFFLPMFPKVLRRKFYGHCLAAWGDAHENYKKYLLFVLRHGLRLYNEWGREENSRLSWSILHPGNKRKYILLLVKDAKKVFVLHEK